METTHNQYCCPNKVIETVEEVDKHEQTI
jgi:hypothetical protein